MAKSIPATAADKVTLLSRSFQENADNSMRAAEIRVVGEQLRLRLHNAKLIQLRERHMFTYPNCFVAKEVVDWLIERKEAPDRETAINIMQKLMDFNVLHHACDEHKVFKDAKLYYRFRGDDGTLTLTEQITIANRSRELYDMMMNQEDCILKTREEDSVQYRRTFHGFEILNWLVDNYQVRSRIDGEQLCRKMLKHGIIQHVTRQHPFSDSDLLYQFTINFQRKRKLIEVLSDPLQNPRPDSPDSPFSLRKLSCELPRIGFVVADDQAPAPEPPPRRSSSGIGTSYTYPLVNRPVGQPPSVLKRPVTVEELLNPGDQYIEKTLSIVGDRVALEFLVQGTGPCYVEVVDPYGSASALAGLKARQFIKSINGINCLRLDSKTINKIVIASPRSLVMEVLEPTY
ncbi:DEP domain-containing mTOR-interacting protein [Eleutherodactylus coqui]|uniref:DEP domain-containing mTOR-interacting protein n=1 Tax=Eleutherodactylus coqui TaxID=57060 RepID=UPI003461FF40